MSGNVIVKDTRDRGKGVFALRDFKKDEFILHIDGNIVETDDPYSFVDDVQDHLFPVGQRGKRRIYVIQEPPGRYINHSCEPNAGIRNDRDIVAMRPIKKGEEIVFDYAMNNHEGVIDRWQMRCHCGSKKCRKVISTFGVLDEKTKKKYRNYVTDCVRERCLEGSKEG